MIKLLKLKKEKEKKKILNAARECYLQGNIILNGSRFLIWNQEALREELCIEKELSTTGLSVQTILQELRENNDLLK